MLQLQGPQRYERIEGPGPRDQTTFSNFTGLSHLLNDNSAYLRRLQENFRRYEGSQKAVYFWEELRTPILRGSITVR